MSVHLTSELFGRVVVAFTAPAPQDTHAIGCVVSYADFPTVNIETAASDQINWAAHLCREATSEEAIAYWRQRAMRAEQQAGSVI